MHLSKKNRQSGDRKATKYQRNEKRQKGDIGEKNRVRSRIRTETNRRERKKTKQILKRDKKYKKWKGNKRDRT